MKGQLFFDYQTLICGNESAVFEKLPQVSETHIKQGYYQGEKVILFFMSNQFGTAEIELLESKNDISQGTQEFDLVIECHLKVTDRKFSVMTMPDGELLEIPINPGFYRIQIGRKAILSERLGAAENIPRESVTIILCSDV